MELQMHLLHFKIHYLHFENEIIRTLPKVKYVKPRSYFLFLRQGRRTIRQAALCPVSYHSQSKRSMSSSVSWSPLCTSMMHKSLSAITV